MSTMQAVRPAAGADFELVYLPVPDPAANEVRVRGEACGICHSDAFVKEGTFPGLEYPRVPGHEVAGVVDAVGSDVSQWEGDRVGVGRHGGTVVRSPSPALWPGARLGRRHSGTMRIVGDEQIFGPQVTIAVCLSSPTLSSGVHLSVCRPVEEPIDSCFPP